MIKEDISITNDIAHAILSGEEVKSFVNRYRRKDGDIAYNWWSARRDPGSQLMYWVARDVKENWDRKCC